MATGKVISFDGFRGYGFIAPDRGGEDVFMHVNDLDGDKSLASVDARVEFMVENGGKGLKASHVRVLEQPITPSPLPRAAPKPIPTPATIASMVSPGPAVVAPDRQADDSGFCDVLSVKEFTQEITEAVLTAVPAMNAEQILRVRTCFIGLAQTHGWVEA
ncbi:cold shock CspA family protein [Streptosporangium album]|uniref:Cold shock CspA family protein n=1 Tax=Streptosporangium album TaxID=47479 RepID=A0A7W7S3R8_9ACTN|nr:cold shock domain-containing protein [Streptosporangium album]MBB4942683.1 cold shock CspA family protein [Streptosporangium album]